MTKRISALTPDGVAWPTVSERQILRTPQRMALPYSAFSVSPSARVVSSVTNITGRPSRTAKETDSSAVRSIPSIVHPSAKSRMGELPMNAHTSSGTPVSWEIRAAGRTSASTVRHAQLAVMDSFASRISSHSRVMSATARGPAPGSPMFAVWIPNSSIMCSSSILAPTGGSMTDGD